MQRCPSRSEEGLRDDEAMDWELCRHLGGRRRLLHVSLSVEAVHGLSRRAHSIGGTSMRHRLRSVLVFWVLFMFSSLSAIPAYASSGSGGSPRSLLVFLSSSPASPAMIRRGLGRLPGMGSATNSIIICTPNVQYPHDSTHELGTVNEVVTVSCTAPVTEIQVVARLYYKSVLVKQSPIERCSNTASCKANAAVSCQNGDYRGAMSWGVYFPPGYEPPTYSNVGYGKTVTIVC